MKMKIINRKKIWIKKYKKNLDKNNHQKKNKQFTRKSNTNINKYKINIKIILIIKNNILLINYRIHQDQIKVDLIMTSKLIIDLFNQVL